MTRFLAVLAAITLIVTSFATPTASAQTQPRVDEQTFISRVNEIRAGLGLPALQRDGELTNLARSWSQSQSNGECPGGAYICHASPISAGVTHNWAKLGENVGTGPNIDSIMDAFIASSGHYANIIDPEFTHIGVGVVWDGNRMYTTHRFMAVHGSAPTTTQAPTTTSAPTTSAPATTSAPQTTSAPTTSAPSNQAPTTQANQTGNVPTTTSAPTTTSEPSTVPSNNEAAEINVTEPRITAILGALSDLSS